MKKLHEAKKNSKLIITEAKSSKIKFNHRQFIGVPYVVVE